MQRRIVEVITGEFCPRVTVLDYHGPIADIASFITLEFTPIEGESSYAGWQRCTINVSGPCCTEGEAGYDGCSNELLLPEELESQICQDCADKKAGGEE